METLKIESPAFLHNGMIPEKYTCQGQNISPQIKWSQGPAGTKTYVLICDDPDAPSGNWDHWLLFNIPAHMAALPENFKLNSNPVREIQAGMNDFRKLDYGGPCPPSGTHRYFFKIYALDLSLNIKAGIRKKDIENAMQGHILAKGELIGKFSKR